jgi:hypothetical protein
VVVYQQETSGNVSYIRTSPYSTTLTRWWDTQMHEGELRCLPGFCWRDPRSKRCTWLYLILSWATSLYALWDGSHMSINFFFLY